MNNNEDEELKRNLEEAERELEKEVESKFNNIKNEPKSEKTNVIEGKIVEDTSNKKEALNEEEKNKKATIWASIGLVLLLSIFFADIYSGILLLISFIIMLCVKIKFPKNTMGKILFWIWIVLIIVAIIFIIAIIYLINTCMNGLGCS